MGKAWKFGENLNTDEIIPGRYNITIDPQELAGHVFCEIKPDYAKLAKAGDVIVGGRNFGCGSSREHAPLAIKGSGAKCVIAPSFARIFYRNAINIGLPILECPQAEDIEEGDELQVDPASGKIENLTQKCSYQANPLPAFILKIISGGGWVNYLKNHDINELVE